MYKDVKYNIIIKYCKSNVKVVGNNKIDMYYLRNIIKYK